LETYTLRDVVDDEEEYGRARVQARVLNMLKNMARMIEIARSEAGRTPEDRREYITNAHLCEVSDASVTVEVESSWKP
jgi:hypothetical protein